MGHRFAEIAFTPAVQAQQEARGSRASYARLAEGEARNDRLGAKEVEFIQARDGFYLASVSETGWPYVQFRGGPPGFLRVIDECTLAWADFRGNRQYVSVGNLGGDDRVSLILMDYANLKRIKLFGRAEMLETALRWNAPCGCTSPVSTGTARSTSRRASRSTRSSRR